MEEETLSEKRRRAGRLGGLSTVARHGAAELSRRGVEGRRAKAEREVDPDGVLTPQDRRQRADALLYMQGLRLSAQGLAARRRAYVRSQDRDEDELNRAVLQIARPPAACVYCLIEAGTPFPDGHTHQTCAVHQLQLVAA